MKYSDYLTVYREGIKHNMILKKYIPIQESLFKIFEHLDNKKDFYYKTDIVVFVKDLLSLISRAMKEKKIDEIKEILDFMIVIDAHCLRIHSFVDALVFKDESDNDKANSHLWYKFKIMDLCDLSCDAKDKVLNLNSNNRFIKIMQIYLKYLKTEYINHPIKTTESEIINEFNRIARGVIPDIYNSDLNLDLLDRFFDDIINDYYNIMDYLELNGLLFRQEYEYDILNVVEVLKQRDKEKIIIR